MFNAYFQYSHLYPIKYFISININCSAAIFDWSANSDKFHIY